MSETTPSKKKRKLRAKDILVYVVTVLFLLVGIGLVSYPTVSNWWNNLHQSRAVAGYVTEVEHMTAEEKEDILNAVREFNKRVAATAGTFEFSESEKAEYESLLNLSGIGIMGYIEIPKISVRLPIYHGTDESILQIAVGHIEGTSMPVGGESTHVALSGHRGLPSAKLFTDLDQLVIGDTFSITVLDEVLTYELCQIDTVLPEEMDLLKVVPGEDLVTLVTCTPYGVNSHRLLLRGKRIPTPEKPPEPPAQPIVPTEVVDMSVKYGPIAAGVAGGCILLLIILLIKKKHKK